MGQQQLLLLVLSIVVVGLAVVMGIQAFNENRQKSEVDRYTDIGVAMAGDLIAWYQKPTAHGGGGGTQDNLADLTIEDLGYPIDPDQTTTWSGYQLTGVNSDGLIRYLGTDTVHPFFHIHEMPRRTGMMRVEVHVFGPSKDCIVTRNGPFNVGAPWSDGKGESGAPDNPNPAACSW